jgi:hypothetical protein
MRSPGRQDSWRPGLPKSGLPKSGVPKFRLAEIRVSENGAMAENREQTQ